MIEKLLLRNYVGSEGFLNPSPCPSPHGRGNVVADLLKLIPLSLVVLLLFGCSQKAQISNEGMEVKELILHSPDGGMVEILAEIADEPEERMQGLMLREDLPEGEGMLFIFDEERVLQFWMKNTLISLDIIFFDEEGKFISSTTMVPCKRDPCRVYRSGNNAKYALEVLAGFALEEGVGVGWKLKR